MTTKSPNPDLITADENAEALLNAKIKRVNKKSIVGALIATAVLDIFTIPLGPTFNDVWFLIGWASFVSFMSFALLYQILFHLFGGAVVEEAKKRGQYLVKQGEGFSDHDHRYSPLFDHLPINIYFKD